MNLSAHVPEDNCCSYLEQATTKSQISFPNVYALIIGIDKYDQIPQLSGAVADANSMSNYLKNDLSVPPSQIIDLRDQQATRSAIVKAFHTLRDNDKIKPMTPILIYYSGHGSEMDSPAGKSEPKIQCILPQDVKCTDDTGNVICAIPAYTLAALLGDLSESKGNNITVVFDSCHSAGGTRGAGDFGGNGSSRPRKVILPVHQRPTHTPTSPHGTLTTPTVDETHTARSVPISVDLPKLHSELDKDILSFRSSYSALPSARPWAGLSKLQSEVPIEDTSIQDTFRGGTRSYVLLAACGKEEVAFECAGHHRGYFTSTLLHVLRNTPLDKLTYKSCVGNFPKLNTPRVQSPICEGEFIDRFFFNASAPSTDDSFIPVVKEDDAYFLKAGVAQGIMPGATFSLHKSDIPGPGNPSLGTFAIDPDKDDPFRSRCRQIPELFNFISAYHPAYAQLVESPSDPSLALLQIPDQSTLGVSQSLGDQLPPETLRRDQLSLGINHETGDIIWEIISGPGKGSVVGVLPSAISPDEDSVKRALTSMAHWNQHVSRVPDSRPFAKSVQLQLYRLQEGNARSSDSRGQRLEPVGGNLLQNGATTIRASSEDEYGFKVVNKTNRQLYAYPFYFSTIKQYIRPLFLKVAGNSQVDPSLASGSELTVGYHNDDLGPISFELDEQVQLDVGTLRIFVTTAPTDFESVAQPSPFSRTEIPASSDSRLHNYGPKFINRTSPQSVDTPGPKPPGLDQHRMANGAMGSIRRVGVHLQIPHIVTDHGEIEHVLQSQQLWDVIEARIVVRASN